MHRNHKTVLRLLCVPFLLLGPALRGQGAAQPDTYTEGLRAMQQHSYSAAAGAFAHAVAVDALLPSPLHPDAALQEARARFELGEYSAAESALHSFLRLRPSSPEALYLLAFVQQRQNRPKESLATYTAAASVAQPSAEDLRRVSLNYVLLNSYPDALHWLTRATGADPRNAEAWYDLARVQMHEGRFDLAIEALQKSLAINAGDARALGNLAKCLENQNRVDDAENAYKAAVAAAEIAPHPVEQPFVDYGGLLNTGNRFSDALPLLQRATQLAPQDPRAFEELARAEAGLKRMQQAETDMRHAVTLDAGNPRLHYQLGHILRTLGKAEDAAKEFSTSSRLFGNTSAE